jgi:PBSX family phage portal protein
MSTHATSRRITRTALRAEPREVTTRTTIFQVKREEDSTSQQLEYVDEFATMYGTGDIILPPPYGVHKLFQVIERSNALRPCIDAYVTNVVRPGWEVVPMRREGRANEGEKAELLSFVENANSEESLCAVMSKVVRDRESVGYGFLEIIRDITGELSLLRHAPAITTRLAPKNKNEVLVEYTIQRGRRVSTVKEFRKFRRFCQRVQGSTVWFKEFGDPRKLNRTTGIFEGDEGYTAGNEATEILHFKLPSNEPYGVPRWINQLPSILGSREAEEVNMRYFEDNTVPPMMLTVAGGKLTNQSYKELNAMLQTGDVGKNRQNRIMLLEAVGVSDSLDGNATPVQLKVEKLTDARQSDSLFKEYDDANMTKVRSAWRLGAVLVGMGADVNYANSQVAVALAESQVFGPDRSELDEQLNKTVVNGDRGLSMKSIVLVSRVPAITSPETTIKALTALNVMGGVTPRTAVVSANTFLQQELPEYPEKGEDGYEEWMDQPLTVFLKSAANTHAEQAAKDQAAKDLEATGDVSLKQPEKGAEGEAL